MLPKELSIDITSLNRNKYLFIASESISKAIIKYLDILIENRRNDVIENATIIGDGRIVDKRISKFQNRTDEH